MGKLLSPKSARQKSSHVQNTLFLTRTVLKINLFCNSATDLGRACVMWWKHPLESPLASLLSKGGGRGQKHL